MIEVGQVCKYVNTELFGSRKYETYMCTVVEKDNTYGDTAYRVKMHETNNTFWADGENIFDENTYIPTRGVICKFKLPNTDKEAYGIPFKMVESEERFGDYAPRLVINVGCVQYYAKIKDCAEVTPIRMIGKRGAIVELVDNKMFDYEVHNPRTGNTYDLSKQRDNHFVFEYDGSFYQISASNHMVTQINGDSYSDMAYCPHCGKLEFSNKLNEGRTIYYSTSSSSLACVNCIVEKGLVRCHDCGTLLPADNTGLAKIDYNTDARVCNSCLERNYSPCEDCGLYVRRYMMYNVNGMSYCRSCAENNHNMRECSSCGNIYFADTPQDRGYCPSCLASIQNYDGKILRYHAPYCLDFKGNQGELYMGVELEVDRGGESNINARIIHEIIGKGNAVMMRDGSLSNGFEIVSAPATLNAHLNQIPWQETMRKLISMGYRSHDAGTCGLHVHVDRAYFKDMTTEEYENKFAMLFANNVDWIKKISRRNRWSYCEVTNDASMKTTPSEAKNGVYKAKPYKGNSHSVAVNYGTDKPTIEIRIFRGTLKYPTFAATLQFVQIFADFVKYKTSEELASANVVSFITEAQTRGYSELLQYLAGYNVCPEIFTNEEEAV